MRVLNIHSRDIAAAAEAVGTLLDGLASPGDGLWPKEQWPAMAFDGPLAPGARGGHGPVRYTVATQVPGRAVRFAFTAPRGFGGTHGFEATPLSPTRTRLTHTLEMDAIGPARLTWPLVFRRLHDALLEDALDKAERSLGREPTRPARWSPAVRALRWAAGRWPGVRRQPSRTSAR